MEEIYRKQRNQQSYLKRKAILQEKERTIEMERQEKIARIDAIRKSIVGFIIEKSESGQPYHPKEIRRMFIREDTGDAAFIISEKQLVLDRFRQRSESVDIPASTDRNADLYLMAMTDLTKEEENLRTRLLALDHAKQMKTTNFFKDCETVMKSIFRDIAIEAIEKESEEIDAAASRNQEKRQRVEAVVGGAIATAPVAAPASAPIVGGGTSLLGAIFGSPAPAPAGP